MAAWAFIRLDTDITPVVRYNGKSTTLANKSTLPGDPSHVTYDVKRGVTTVGTYTLNGQSANVVVGTIKNTSGASATFAHELQFTLPTATSSLAMLDYDGTVPTTFKRKYFPYSWKGNISNTYPFDLSVPGFTYDGRYYANASKELAEISHKVLGSNYVVSFLNLTPANQDKDTAEEGVVLANNASDSMTIYSNTSLASSLNSVYGNPAGSVSTTGRWTIVFNTSWTAAGPDHYLSSTQWDTMAAALQGKIDAIIVVTAGPHDIIPTAFHKKGIKVFYYMSSVGVRWTGTSVDCVITGGISGSTLTVDSVTTPILEAGMTLTYAGGAVGVIASQLTGTTGDAGTYSLQSAVTVAAHSTINAAYPTGKEIIDNGAWTGTFTNGSVTMDKYMYDANGDLMQTDCQGWNLLNLRGSGTGTPHDDLISVAHTAVGAGYDGVLFDHASVFYYGTDPDRWIGGDCPGATQSWQAARSQFVIDLRTAIQNVIQASGTGSITTGGAMTVSALLSGRYAIGQTVTWTAGGGGSTVITGFTSADGGTGTYTVSPAPGTAVTAGSTLTGICNGMTSSIANQYHGGLAAYDFNIKEALLESWALQDSSPYENWTTNYDHLGDKWLDQQYALYTSNLVIGHKGLSPLVCRTAFRNWLALPRNQYFIQGPNLLAIPLGESPKFGKTLTAWNDIHANICAYDASSASGTDIVYLDPDTQIVARGTSIVSPATETTVTFNWPTYVMFLGDPAGGSSHTLVLTPTYATWDASKKNTGVTLSGSNLTATNGNTNVLSNVFATDMDVTWDATSDTGKGSGLFYWKVTLTTSSVGNARVGIGNTSSTVANGDYIGKDLNSVGLVGSAGGGIFMNGVNRFAWASPFSSGNTIEIALDRRHKRIWFRNLTTGGNWNNNASADPTNYTTGFDLTANSCTVCNADILPGATLYGNGDTMVAIFKTDTTAGLPAGYGQYDQQSVTMTARGLYAVAERKTTTWHWTGYGFAANGSNWVEGDFRLMAAPTGDTSSTMVFPIMTVPGPASATKEKQANTYFTAKHFLTHFTAAPLSWTLKNSTGSTTVAGPFTTSLSAAMDLDLTSICTDWTQYQLQFQF